MSNPTSDRAWDARARAHIKALIDETKRQASSAPPEIQPFLGGTLSGLAASVEILNGGTAEASQERMAQRLAAVIGEAYLAGNLPPRPPAEEHLLADGTEAGFRAALIAEEEARRTARRASLRNLVDRAGRGVALGAGEAELMRQQAEAEIREADTARTVAAGNLRHVQTLVPELQEAQAAIARVRHLSEMPIAHSVRVAARQQALDTLAALDEQPAQNAGPSVAECARQDAAHWNDKYDRN